MSVIRIEDSGHYEGSIRQSTQPLATAVARQVLECPHCPEKFASRDAYQSHERSHRVYVDCTLCGEEIASPKALVAHFKEIHPDRYMGTPEKKAAPRGKQAAPNKSKRAGGQRASVSKRRKTRSQSQEKPSVEILPTTKKSSNPQMPIFSPVEQVETSSAWLSPPMCEATAINGGAVTTTQVSTLRSVELEETSSALFSPSVEAEAIFDELGVEGAETGRTSAEAVKELLPGLLQKFCDRASSRRSRSATPPGNIRLLTPCSMSSSTRSSTPLSMSGTTSTSPSPAEFSVETSRASTPPVFVCQQCNVSFLSKQKAHDHLIQAHWTGSTPLATVGTSVQDRVEYMALLPEENPASEAARELFGAHD